MGSVNLCCIEPRRAERSIRGGREGNKSMQGWRSAGLAVPGLPRSHLNTFHPSEPAGGTLPPRQQVLSLTAQCVLCRLLRAGSSCSCLTWLAQLPAPPAWPGALPRGLRQLEAAALGCWEGLRGWAPHDCSVMTFTEPWNYGMVELEGTKGP